MKFIDYSVYQGNDESHGLFWWELSKFPPKQHLAAFLDFYKQVKLEVETERCSLREAGYALAPGGYDKAIRQATRSGNITIGCEAAEYLASWIYGDIKEAWEDWRIVVEALDGLIESSERFQNKL